MFEHPDDYEATVTAAVCDPQACSYLELRYCQDGTVAEDTGELAAEQAVSWFELGSPDQEPEGKRIRFLVTGHPGTVIYKNKLPFSRPDISHLVDVIGFPDEFFFNVRKVRHGTRRYNFNGTQCWTFLSQHVAVAVLQPATGVVTLVMIVPLLDQLFKPDRMVARLISAKEKFLNPMFSILALASIATEDLHIWSEKYSRKAFDHQFSLGVHTDAESRVKRPGSLDVSTVEVLMGEMSGILNALYILKQLQLSLQTLGRFNSDHVQQRVKTATSMDEKLRIADDKLQFDLQLENILGSVSGSLHNVQIAEKRILNIQSLAQLQLTQRDTQASLELARKSAEIALAAKKDSASMIIIAVLTTMFLPATYVATLLSTPAYNALTSDNVWLYWSIAAPLTLIVMAALLIWMRYIRNNNGDEKPRNVCDSEKGKVE